MDAQTDRLIAFFREQHGCHTLILFGSRAQGTERPDSDWDLVGINDAEIEAYFHDDIEGVGEVNCYLYPTDMTVWNNVFPPKLFMPPDMFCTRLQHGKVLMQRDTIGDNIVVQAKEMIARGPGFPSDAKVNSHYHYFFHTRLEVYLDENVPLREGVPDALRDYMRHEALMRAYHQYFWLRGMWPLDPKYGAEYLLNEDFQTHEAFARANAADATRDDFNQLFQLVMDRGL